MVLEQEEWDASVSLVFDASNHYIVAGVFGQELSIEHVEFAPQMAFQKLHQTLKKLLVHLEEKTGKKQPDWIGATIGPGSFTGLRISVGTARNLSQLWGIPVLGTDSLSFVARVFIEELAGMQYPEKLAVLLDGRQKQVYWKIFDLSASNIWDVSGNEIQDTSPALPLELLAKHPKNMLLCVDNPTRVASYLSGDNRQLWQLYEGQNRIRKWPLPSAWILYKHLCAIGGRAKARSWQELLPLYIRSDPATSNHPRGFSHALGT